MKPGDSISRTLVIYDILRSRSDRNHILSMNELLDELDLEGISADRRTAYNALHALQDNGYDIRYTRTPKQGWYLEHTFTPAETLILSDAVRNAPSLSVAHTEVLLEKLMHELSDWQRDALKDTRANVQKTDNEEVPDSLDILQRAAAENRTVSFLYYDITPEREKKYRREGRPYILDPYAIVSGNDRFYCIARSREHSTFSAYRIDKMEKVTFTGDLFDPLPFDTDSWLRSSFDMYAGDPQTITCDFDISLASIVFDRFGTDIIISRIGDDTFRASIRTALTPTLLSWILMFSDRIRVLHPKELIDQLLETADTLNAMYRKEPHEQPGKD